MCFLLKYPSSQPCIAISQGDGDMMGESSTWNFCVEENLTRVQKELYILRNHVPGTKCSLTRFLSSFLLRPNLISSLLCLTKLNKWKIIVFGFVKMYIIYSQQKSPAHNISHFLFKK